MIRQTAIQLFTVREVAPSLQIGICIFSAESQNSAGVIRVYLSEVIMPEK
jgi:hypothetical protein